MRIYFEMDINCVFYYLLDDSLQKFDENIKGFRFNVIISKKSHKLHYTHVCMEYKTICESLANV